MLLLAAGCGERRAPSATARGPAPAAQCYDALARRGAAFTPVAGVGDGACAVPAPVRLERTTASLHEPVITSCAMALALYDFEERVMQPLALRRFGLPVTRIYHYGSHACRGVAGGGGRSSAHARGLAIDVAGFELADGRIVLVGEDWHGPSAARAYLHDVARAACDRFSVTLTPNSDRAHRDHFHFDMGPYRHCGY
ncbi:MAG TPA: extensin family protein [Geminicoccaceae bacterium]|nr:extensin family protein [Geminicoccaceae bacterium]